MAEPENPENNDTNTESKSSESNTPPVDQNQQTAANNSSDSSKKYKTVIYLLVFLLVLVVGGAAAMFMSSDDNNDNPASNSAEQKTSNAENKEAESEEEKTEAPVPETFTSMLYPDFSFTLPVGWEVTEPESYDEADWGPGSAAGVIEASKDGVTVSFEMVTIYATGFEGYSCYDFSDLASVGDYYRYTDSEDVVVYTAGVSDTDENWAEIIGDSDFTSLDDPDPNICIGFPYLGTYSSTLNQADYELPYGHTSNEKVMVWLAVAVEGSPSDELLAEIDSMLTTKSDSAEVL